MLRSTFLNALSVQGMPTVLFDYRRYVLIVLPDCVYVQPGIRKFTGWFGYAKLANS